MSEEWPIDKSPVTKRTPTRRISPEVNRIIQRFSQRLQKKKIREENKQNPATPIDINKPSTSREATTNNIPQQDKIKKTLGTQFIKIEEQKENKYTKMENKLTIPQIHQLISHGIPEFSGENNSQLNRNFTKFLDMANSTYNSLKSEEEKAIFDNFIRIKLTDEAFDRVYIRNLKTYPEIKEFLLQIYSEVKSLEELEREYTSIKQGYGETVSNYGNRIQDALTKYKRMYKQNYNLKNMDETYNKHLQNNAIKVFKRGLNNTIVKDKMITSSADSIQEIILETEKIEKILSDFSTQPESNPVVTQKDNYPTNQNISKVNPLHQAQRTITPQYDKPPKFCSYCKTTSGHTFNECRNKFFQNRGPINPNFQPRYSNYNQRNFNYPNNQNNSQQNYYRGYNNPNNNQRNNYPNNNSTNNYQPRNNYPQNNANYNQNQQRNYPTNNSDPNQPSTSRNFTAQGEKNDNASNLTSDQKLLEMMKQLAINHVFPEKSEIPQNNNQGNENGSSQD